jgi:hypothetical protein
VSIESAYEQHVHNTIQPLTGVAQLGVLDTHKHEVGEHAQVTDDIEGQGEGRMAQIGQHES